MKPKRPKSGTDSRALMLRTEYDGLEQGEAPSPDSAVRLGKVGAKVSSVRVLVVEDFVSFRRFISSTLAGIHDLQIIGEVSDGLEAVQKAEVLKPDLILLDIGLSTLNGIEAARRILKVAPESKIIFVSQESSADVVQAALELGARGYVVKANAASDLVAAVEAVLSGKTFARGI